MPSLDEAYLAFTQEERSKGIACGKAEKEEIQTQSIFALKADRNRTRFERPDKSKLTCTHCKKRGHEVSTCFTLHGIPPWFEELKNRRAKPSAASDSSSSHSASAAARVPARANAITGPTTTHDEVGTSCGSFLDNLKPKQQQALLTMLNNQDLHQMTGWKLYDLDTGDIFVSHDVKFHENEFPFGDELDGSLGDTTIQCAGHDEVDVSFLEHLEGVLHTPLQDDMAAATGGLR
uniref:Retroviral polymerase SH3-like domain-containing protein n=1 Tax=Chenopodium quinoa TaxID=63459 RepID=A0A803MAX7_CHEQI